MPPKKDGLRANLAMRIKRVMQSDDDVGRIAKESPAVIAAALELFAADLCSEVTSLVKTRGEGQIKPGHVKAIVEKESRFDFLKEAVAQAPELGPPVPAGEGKPKRPRQPKKKAKAMSEDEASGDDSDSGAAPPPKQQKRKRAPAPAPAPAKAAPAPAPAPAPVAAPQSPRNVTTIPSAAMGRTAVDMIAADGPLEGW
mmetsp:Transcript_12061/g.39686  ORF Transcript_12061/g.39686 Transcript_12061/m.39686 type:complete len:198 (-) Transcript_12061:64-657(-)